MVSYTREYTDSFGFSEDFVRAVSYVRAYTDSFGFSDTRDVSLTKVFNDSITVFDKEINPLNTSLLNAKVLNVKDTSIVFTKGKTPSELFGLSDITVFGYNKGISDSVTTSDINTVSFSKSDSDSYTVTDESTLSSDISKTDSVSFGDLYASAIGKVITDAFTLDDSTLVDKNFYGNKGNIFGFSDVLSKTIAFNRGFTETLGFSEVKNKYLSKEFSDSSTMSDSIIVSPVKQLNESFTFSDAFGLQLEKTLSDGFGLDDSALIDKDYFGNKGNIVGISDQVTVDYYYGGLVGQRPLNTMSFN